MESVVDSVAQPGVPVSGLASSLPMRVVAAARAGIGWRFAASGSS